MLKKFFSGRKKGLLPTIRRKFNRQDEKVGALTPFFDSFLTDPWGITFPRVDVVEKGKKVYVMAEIPGMEKDDIEVRLLDDMRLSISGTRSEESETRDGDFWCAERVYGSFSRIITLPCPVDPEEIDATYRRGVLKIKLRKAKESETYRIPVKVE